MARVFDHNTLVELSKYATVPVINALSDKYHPCQTLADLMTILEKKGKLSGLKIAYIGDGGCNTCHSTIIGCVMVGMAVAVACPNIKKFQPDEEILERAKKYGTKIEVFSSPEEAVKDADVVYTDVWVSMGDEVESEERIKFFSLYQVNKELMSYAKKDAIFMHCLPAVKSQEVTEDVTDSKQSVVYDQAENRLHTEKALMLFLFCV